MERAVLSIAYFPPIQFFTKFFKYKVFIEKHEHFVKQTYRNRMLILTSTGVHSLIVPVKRKNNIPIIDIQIDNSVSWQRNHIKALQTAYGSSPFFYYMIDEIIEIYTKQYKYLWDLDIDTIQVIFKLLNLDFSLEYTESFYPPAKDEFDKLPFKDFRYNIRPKNPPDDEEFVPEPYIQVFSDKFAFIPNLTILDLIFNKGPESVEILKNSIKLNE